MDPQSRAAVFPKQDKEKENTPGIGIYLCLLLEMSNYMIIYVYDQLRSSQDAVRYWNISTLSCKARPLPMLGLPNAEVTAIEIYLQDPSTSGIAAAHLFAKL